jgi:hypothetical protein
LFLSYFPIGHVWLMALAASVWVKSGLLSALLGGGLAAFLLAIYLRSPLRRLSLKDLAVYSLVTCIINASCTIGSLAGGLRRGRLFMYPGV